MTQPLPASQTHACSHLYKPQGFMGIVVLRLVCQSKMTYKICFFRNKISEIIISGGLNVNLWSCYIMQESLQKPAAPPTSKLYQQWVKIILASAGLSIFQLYCNLKLLCASSKYGQKQLNYSVAIKSSRETHCPCVLCRASSMDTRDSFLPTFQKKCLMMQRFFSLTHHLVMPRTLQHG